MSTTPDTYTRHEYTDAEILHAWNHRKYLPGQMVKTLDNLRAFLAALPERPQAAEIAKLKDENELMKHNLESQRPWIKKSEKLLDAGRWAGFPWIQGLVTELAERDAQVAALKAELAALRTPIPADDGRSLGQVFAEAYYLLWDVIDSDDKEKMDAAAQAVAAVVEARIIRRMEAVPWRELKHTGYEAIRARLIAAAKGEGQAQEVPQAEAKAEPDQPWTPAVGDTVRLKSGGPVMTVAADTGDDEQVMCAWHGGDGCPHSESYLAACLTPAQP